MRNYIGELASIANNAIKKEARGKEKSVGATARTSHTYKQKKNLRKIVLLALPLAKGQTASFYTKKSRSKLETTLFV